MLCRGGGRRNRLRLRRRCVPAPVLRSRPTGLRRNRGRRARHALPSMVQPRRPRSLRVQHEPPRPCRNSSSNGSRRGRPSLLLRRPRPDRNPRRNRLFSHHRRRHKMAARLRSQEIRILLWSRRRSMVRRSPNTGRFRRAVRAPRRNRRTCLCLPCSGGPPGVRAIRS